MYISRKTHPTDGWFRLTFGLQQLTNFLSLLNVLYREGGLWGIAPFLK